MKSPTNLLSLRIWLLTSLVFGVGWLTYMALVGNFTFWFSCFLAFIASAVGSLPVLFLLMVSSKWIGKKRINSQSKINWFVGICFASVLVYSLAAAIAYWIFIQRLSGLQGVLIELGCCIGVLSACVLLAILFSRGLIIRCFSIYPPDKIFNNQNQTMETTQQTSNWSEQPKLPSSNKILIKGLITGGLILLMLVPTAFIDNLVTERSARQEQVATEVSAKWAGSQILSGPYLYIPYKVTTKDKDGKIQETTESMWLLPEDLHVTGTLQHEIRPRSIYKVLLYRAGLHDNGNFTLRLPSNVDPSVVKWQEAKICFSLSDFKGIEERLSVHLGGTDYELSPGLPEAGGNANGLSAQVVLSPTDIGKSLSFSMDLKLKGSGFLHFVPLAGNSDFALKSGWSHPSFDGNNLPTERNLGDSGFDARWTFNKANLPFGTLLRDFQFDKSPLAFGVTMVQPADQYAKTSRSVKYAILIIGLSFSMFFILELMQKKPVHPVQYVLIGLALVIFYTLLLSISEFLLFDTAYLIAALGVILLVSLYARSHFRNWKSAAMFGGVLTLLYGFIFILIRLEDTALLVGSIGLFAILALVMYASRNINWYGTPKMKTA